MWRNFITPHPDIIINLSIFLVWKWFPLTLFFLVVDINICAFLLDFIISQSEPLLSEKLLVFSIILFGNA